MDSKQPKISEDQSFELLYMAQLYHLVNVYITIYKLSYIGI